MASSHDSSRGSTGATPNLSSEDDRVEMGPSKSVPPLTVTSPVEQVFPTLTPEQVARVAQHGRARPVRAGETLASAGRQAESLFVVTKGSVELVRQTGDREEIVAVLKPGQFTGEVNMLSGRPALVSLRAPVDGEVIEVTRDDLLALVQTGSELGDIFMRSASRSS